MPSYLCRRGRKFLFRRKIPLDVKSAFGRNELVLSLGDSLPGEARRIAYQLWFESEFLFMSLRDLKKFASPAETDAAAQRLLNAFEGRLEAAQAAVIPDLAMPGLDEPVAQAAWCRGLAAMTRSMADRNDIAALARNLSPLVAEPGSEDLSEAAARVIARKMLKGVPPAASRAAEGFEALAQYRPAALPVKILSGTAADADPDLLTALRKIENGPLAPELQARLDALIAAPESAVPASVAPPSVLPLNTLRAAPVCAGPGPATAGPSSDPADPSLPGPDIAPDTRRPGKNSALITVLWDKYCAFKVAQNEWKPAERVDAASTLALFINICGDREAYFYDEDDAFDFLLIYSNAPHDFYSNRDYRQIYERDGLRALVAELRGRDYQKLSFKTFNKHRGRLHGFWGWASDVGMAILPKNAASIFENISIRNKTPKRTGAKRREAERMFLPDEILRLCNTPLFLGCRSERKWKIAGPQVYRNERYWFLLCGIHHGNRREEMAILRVKHVKCEHGIWYIDFTDPTLDGLLKDEGSYRELPIHDNLIQLGFLQARVEGRDPDARLFPEALSLAAVARQAEPFGKFFLQFRRFHGAGDERLDFHAWRGTVTTNLLDLGHPPAFIEGALGWEGPRRTSELDTYDKKARLHLLKSMINTWQPPIDLPAMIEAVRQSDMIDKSAAWPDLGAAERQRAALLDAARRDAGDGGARRLTRMRVSQTNTKNSQKVIGK